MKDGIEVCRKCNGKGCLYCDGNGKVDWIDNIINKSVNFEDRIVKILSKELAKEIDNDIVNAILKRSVNDNRKLS